MCCNSVEQKNSSEIHCWYRHRFLILHRHGVAVQRQNRQIQSQPCASGFRHWSGTTSFGEPSVQAVVDDVRNEVTKQMLTVQVCTASKFSHQIVCAKVRQMTRSMPGWSTCSMASWAFFAPRETTRPCSGECTPLRTSGQLRVLASTHWHVASSLH